MSQRVDACGSCHLGRQIQSKLRVVDDKPWRDLRIIHRHFTRREFARVSDPINCRHLRTSIGGRNGNHGNKELILWRCSSQSMGYCLCHSNWTTTTHPDNCIYFIFKGKPEYFINLSILNVRLNTIKRCDEAL